MSKKNENENKKKKNKAIIASILIIVCLLLVIGTFVFLAVANNKKDEKEKLSYTELIKKIDNNEVVKIEMREASNTAEITLKDTVEGEEEKVKIPNTQAFMELINNKVLEGKEIKLIQNPKNTLVSVSSTLLSLFPTIILFVLFLVLMKTQGLGEKGKVYDAETTKTKIKFDDVAGLDEEKQELIEIVDFLKNPEKFTKMGAKIPRGVLLCGKPGTGKTLVAKAIAGEANVPFISMSGSEFIEMFAGLGASRVRKLFEKAKKIAPCIIFIDEIDAIGSRRTNATGAESENNQTLNQLLVEMDGFNREETIIVLAATNRPEMLDKALLRPGRFDRQITVAPPDIKGREEILKIHSKDKKLDDTVNLKSIAEDTAGFTGAELANVLNEAAITAAVKGHEAIINEDIEDAVKKVTVGLEKTSRVISEKDKKLTAYHEAGHAVVGYYLETQSEIKEVSIIPRGFAGGYTMYKTNEDKFYISKTEMLERLIALMGGRAAERIALNDISTGASNDIEVATKIARDMIVVYGMNERVGHISINTERDPNELLIFGDEINNEIGAEIRKMVEIAYRDAQSLLVEHRDKLDKLANKLLEKEKVSEEEIKEILA